MKKIVGLICKPIITALSLAETKLMIHTEQSDEGIICFVTLDELGCVVRKKCTKLDGWNVYQWKLFPSHPNKKK